LIVTGVFILLELGVGMRERVGVAWPHDAPDKALDLNVYIERAMFWLKCQNTVILKYLEHELLSKLFQVRLVAA